MAEIVYGNTVRFRDCLVIMVGIRQGRERTMWHLPVKCGRGHNRARLLKKMARAYAECVMIPAWSRRMGMLSLADAARLADEAERTILEAGTKPLKSYMVMPDEAEA